MSVTDCESIESKEPMDCVVTTSANNRTFLPSDNDKIFQSVMVGSVFLALESKFFTYEALLKWLSTAEFNDRTQIAYKAVCTKIQPNEQYLEDRFHFLTKKSEYTTIAVGYGLNPEIADQSIEGSIEHNPILAHICDALTSLNNNSNTRRMSALILAGQGTKEFLRSKLATCYRARNFPHLRISAHEINVGLVESDWVAKFRYNEDLAHVILRRVAKLQKEAPIYYAGVAYGAYHKVAVKINKDKLLTKLTRDELATFDSFFPEVIDRKILEYSDLAYKIALLGNDVAGYVLGFPIQNFIPNESQIHAAIQQLTELGPVKYADRICEYVKNTYIPAPPFPDQSVTGISYSNDKDAMLEDIDVYGPFDIVAYQSGSYIYRYTRVEFENTAQCKKNQWTNEWLPPTVLSTIKARAEAAKELGLPPARPLIEMLERVEKGTLFQSDESPKPPTDQPQERQQRQMNPLEMMMAAAFMGQWSPGLPQNDDDIDDLGGFSPNNVQIVQMGGPVQPRAPTSFQSSLMTLPPGLGLIPASVQASVSGLMPRLGNNASETINVGHNNIPRLVDYADDEDFEEDEEEDNEDDTVDDA